MCRFLCYKSWQFLLNNIADFLIFFLLLDMGMSNAERQRKFRQNRDQNANKRQAYLNKERERYVKDKQSGKKRNVKDITNREKRSARKKNGEIKRGRPDHQNSK